MLGQLKRRPLRRRLFRSYPMRLLARISIVLLLMGAGTSLLALQRGGNQSGYQSDDEFGNARRARMDQYETGEARSEYAWSRLRYTAANNYGGGGYGRGSGWSKGYSKADRQFLLALPRLTPIQAPPTEQVLH